ncbi:MAG: response regulator [Treponema sp.]|nr:response regulator [Treponema sp.]
MKTIFVVDDNGINLLMAEEALSDHYEVITMLSVSIMFKLLDKIIPDMILLDIMMPDVDGLNVMKQLKADTRYKEIPVIFLTSKDDAATEALSYKIGAADFIKKPFSKTILLDRIKTILNREPQNKKSEGNEDD